MYLVNNRYRIIKNITHNALISSFSAFDIVNGNKLVNLNIINSENFPKDLQHYFLKEFTTIRNIGSSNIIKLYNYENIFSIDNKRKSEINRIYYTNEPFENDGNISLFVNSLTETKLISLFIGLCQNLNYLHKAGFVYNSLNPENILISLEKDTFKIKDIITAIIEKSDYWTFVPKYMYFQAPEIINGGLPSIASDIYSLGVMLLTFLMKKMPIEMNINFEIKLLKASSGNGNLIFCKLIEVIEKMTSIDAIERHQSINDVVNDINRILDSNFLPHIKEDLEKLHMNIKMIGREYEVDTVMRTYNSILESKDEGKLIFIHGEVGIGKSRFLHKLKHELSFQNADVFYSFSSNKTQQDTNKPLSDILKLLISECDKEILSRYENELIKFVPEIGENKFIIPSESLSGDMERYRLMNRIASFISECMKGRTTVFIIDDIHLVDEFTSNFIQYVVNRKPKKGLFIFTFSDSYNKNKVLSDFFNKNKKNRLVIDIPLRELTIDESHEMIRKFLFQPTVSRVFSDKIYSKTFGNPQFTQEIMKNLLAKKTIYINSQGNWESDYSFEELPLPLNMEQAVLYQVKGFDNSAIELLNILSVFNSAVPAAIIKEFKISSFGKQEDILKFLINKGVILEKIEDFGYAYDFTSTVLKNLIYTRLEEENRLNMHKKAAEILKTFYSSGRISSEELIYHLEKYGEKESIIKYCLANADIMKNLKNRLEEIKNLKKAISIFDNTHIDVTKLMLIVRLAEVCFDDGNYSNSITYYQIAEKNATELNEGKLLVGILNKISSIYFLKNDIKNSEFYLNKVEDILKNNFSEINNLYMEEYLDSVRNKIELLIYYQNYEEANKVLIKALELCNDKYFKQKGMFLQTLGNLHFQNSRDEEALKCYEESIMYFEKINLMSGITQSLNNIGLIYSDFYQNYNKAIECYSIIKEISKENSLIIQQTLALINIGDAYFNLLDYNQSYLYFKEALLMALKTENEKYIFFCYSCLNIVCVKLGYYKELYKYWQLQLFQIDEYPNLKIGFQKYYYSISYVYFDLGEFDKAENFARKLILSYGDVETKAALDAKLLYQQIRLLKEDNIENIDLNIKEIDRIIKKLTFMPGKIDAMLDLAILLMDKGIKSYSAQYLKKAELLIHSDIVKRVDAKRLYLKGMFTKGIKKMEFFTEALKLCNEEKMLELKCKVLYNMGEYYYNKNRLYAVNYYFEACEIAKLIILEIPEEEQLKYFQKQNAILPFNRLICIKEKDKCFNISTLKELHSLFTYRELNDIFTDKELIQTSRKIYYSKLPVNIKSVEDLLLNLDSDCKNNFILICNYVAKLTLATKTLLIIDNHDDGFKIYSPNYDKEITTECKFILDRVRTEKSPVLITSLDMLSNNQMAIICIPILSGSTLLGYLYLESQKIINDFNKETMEKCMTLNSLIGILIDKYQLRINSSIDRLTGTYTKKAMEDATEIVIENASLNHEVFSLIMLDLDNFKSINDSLGHQTGDTVLKNVCKIVLDNLVEPSFCGRFGGEEFVIILPEMALEDAIIFAENLRVQIDNSKILGEKRPVTASMGIVSYPEHGEIQQELIEKADQALYVAKETGRNRCQLWEEGFSKKANVTNKLTGILIGNTVQDYRNVSVMVELINLIKVEAPIENKIYKLIGRIIEITEAQNGSLLLIENNEISKKYSRKIFSENWTDIEFYNKDIISNAIETKEGICCIDWENPGNHDSLTGLPEWHSIITIPLLNNGVLKGILYLSVPLRVKEFSFKEYNFVESLAQISTAMI